MGRPAQPRRAGVRARPHAHRARLRRAGARAVRAVPRGLSRRRRARRFRPAGRRIALRRAAVCRRHGDAHRAPGRRSGQLGRHLDGRADRHGARRAGALAGGAPGAERGRAGGIARLARAHRQLLRRAHAVRDPGRGRSLHARHLGALRAAQRRAMALSHRDLAAAQRRRQLARELRPAHRRGVPRDDAGQGPGAVAAVRRDPLPHARASRRALRSSLERYHGRDAQPRPPGQGSRDRRRRACSDPDASRPDRAAAGLSPGRRARLRHLFLLALFAAAPAFAQSTLDAVKAKGYVQCGVNTGLAGFSQPDSKGVWRGIDVDLCRAVAAAVFGDPGKVRYTPLTAQQRFTALQSGEVDILARNTTWTVVRDTSLGLNFVGVNYYDGQGFMVPKKLNVKSAKELNGATICVQPGTTTELNLADYFRANRMSFKPVVIEKLEEVLNAYFAGRCDVFTTDVSGLVSTRASRAPNPAEHVILPEVISKEPLGPAVRHGDDRWFDVVKWSMFAMLEAEELGLSSKNIGEHAKSPNPSVQRFVGASGDIGQMLGLDNRWAVNIIRLVGNYAESFEANLKPLGFERGLNRLWSDGGLMYAPPIR